MVFGGTSLVFLVATGFGFHIVPLTVLTGATGVAFFLGM
jgi:hypothetical protein